MEQLSAGSLAGRETAPVFLRARIMLEIRRATFTRSRPLFQRQAAALAAFSVCAIAALLLWRERQFALVRRTPPNTGIPQAFAALPGAIGLPNQTQVSRWIGRIDGPLENEMQLVVDDAKTAYDSLAGSFLPANGPR